MDILFSILPGRVGAVPSQAIGLYEWDINGKAGLGAMCYAGTFLVLVSP
jgi:hypothetical protein